MSYQAIASMIPAEYRKEILETNMISRAVVSQTDPSMYYLFTIWRTYVEPGTEISMECGLCLERVLKNYRQLQPTLIELEKNSRLLNA